MVVRQLCLSASLVPQSFVDEMRTPVTEPKGMVTDAPAVVAASMPEEKKAALMTRLRQAISDEEECSVG
jgi:SWI/SNF-related matrix-associated actin-dependent regulator of chromatin subfamily A3